MVQLFNEIKAYFLGFRNFTLLQSYQTNKQKRGFKNNENFDVTLYFFGHSAVRSTVWIRLWPLEKSKKKEEVVTICSESKQRESYFALL